MKARSISSGTAGISDIFGSSQMGASALPTSSCSSMPLPILDFQIPGISATPCTRSGSTRTSRSTSIRHSRSARGKNPLESRSTGSPMRTDQLSGRRDGGADLYQAVRPAGHADGRAGLSQRQRLLPAPADLRPVLRRDPVRELSPTRLLPERWQGELRRRFELASPTFDFTLVRKTNELAAERP